ncbi:hypothetical protein IJH72_00065 [Candidatus Saccharibacteria bacterium]|nr:hypothetical protein [Candidatus Saccharibacteria bacterium]
MKNLRVLLGIVLALSLVLITGCAQGNSTAVEEEPVPVETEESSETVPEEPVEEVLEEEVLEAPEQSPPESGLEMFSVTDAGARSVPNCTCLIRGDSMYSLGLVPIDGSTNPATYNAGIEVSFGGNKCRRLYMIFNQDWVVSIGNVSAPVVNRGDMVVGYSLQSVPTLQLTEAVFHSYGLCAMVWDVTDEHGWVRTGWRVYTGITPDSFVELTDEEIATVCIYDLNGNQVSDGLAGLNYGETYLLSWYKGTQYHEVEVIANSSWYTYESESNIYYWKKPTYEVEGEMTREGYVIYDLSDVPPGTYYLPLNEGVIVVE